MRERCVPGRELLGGRQETPFALRHRVEGQGQARSAPSQVQEGQAQAAPDRHHYHDDACSDDHDTDHDHDAHHDGTVWSMPDLPPVQLGRDVCGRETRARANRPVCVHLPADAGTEMSSHQPAHDRRLSGPPEQHAQGHCGPVSR